VRGKLIRRVNEEHGAALAIALMVMVICALLGAASILTTNTDIRIAINDRIYREALMNADAGIQWLRNQDLEELSGYSDTQRQELNEQIAATSSEIRFELPQNPVFAWADPTAGGASVYLVRVRGWDRNQRGSVLLEAEIRMAPQAGEVDQGGSLTTY